MAKPTIDEMKLYLRVTDTAEDELINTFIAAADNYILRQTGKTTVLTGEEYVDIHSDETFLVCLKLLVAHWYENRGIISPTATNKINHTVDALVNHISMCGDYA